MQWIPAIIGGVSSAYSGAQSRQDGARQAEVMAANARSAKRTAVVNEETQRRQNAQSMGAVRAWASQSGFDPSSGSLADLQSRTAGELELDALTTRYKGDLESLGLTYQGEALTRNARTAQRQGYLNAFASLYSTQVRNNYTSASRINVGSVGD